MVGISPISAIVVAWYNLSVFFFRSSRMRRAKAEKSILLLVAVNIVFCLP